MSKTPPKSDQPMAPSSSDNHDGIDVASDDAASVAAAPKSTASKKNSTPKSNGKTTASSMSKTYVQLCHEAIVALKDRTGSSQPAISKYILTTYPDLYGPHFRSRLNIALKSGVAKERFTKVKSSFKISAAFKAAQKKKSSSSSSNAKKSQLDKSREKTLKLQKALNTDDPAALKKAKADLAKEKAAQEKLAASLEAAKQRADRLKKRRFPMEDTKLHREDKELNVKPPADVTARPHVPYFWNMTLDLDDPARQGKTASGILQYSKADQLDCNSRGVCSDLLQIYHFFRGDVHLSSVLEGAIVPDFTLQQLVYAVDEILQGNMKKSRTVPPLLAHLFVVSLSLLCQPPVPSQAGEQDMAEDAVERAKRQFQRELTSYLGPALSPVSWPDVLFLYMDAMERFCMTDASKNPGILPALATDVDYLMGRTAEAVVPMTPGPVGKNTEAAASPLPEGYFGYLGDPRGSLHRAFTKLGRMDPWLLTAEEILCLLRALTDDLLATLPQISQDIAAREEEMQELLKAKRAADAKYRKVRLAFEGPKKGPAKKDGEAATTETEPFKPTASKKQFEAAKKAQQKASDAYEKGIRKLVARTEPIGYDRHHHPVYCFRHDPEILYVEELRPPATANSSANNNNDMAAIPTEMQFSRRSWHVIETASLFDSFVSSLDIRGKREHDLYEEMLGPQGANQSLRRFLVDDLAQEAAKKAAVAKKEALTKRLEVARKKCEQGRRSGRFANQIEEELVELSEQLEALDDQIAGKAIAPPRRNYADLTGLTLLTKFDAGSQMQTRQTREKAAATALQSTRKVFPCSKLYATGNIDGTGLVGMVVAEMLEVEELCESLAPWERKDVTRSSWISNLEGAVFAWNNMSPTLLGPEDSSAPIVDGNEGTPPRSSSKRDPVESSNSKRRRVDVVSSPSTPTVYSVPSILSLLRTPLVDLEARVADITNLVVATRDAEIADDNLSTDGSEEDRTNRERREKAWKRIVHRIRETPTRRHVQIREMVVTAIAAARKAHLPEVVAQLRAALLKHHPNAAGECKIAAVDVLLAHGDYNPEDDEDADDGLDGAAPADDNAEEEEIPSVLSAEAAVLAGSLDGVDDATRVDWIEAVKACKTISRFGSLTNAFVDNAMKKLTKVTVERDRLLQALSVWEKEEDRKSKGRAGRKTNSKKSSVSGPSEVWANVTFTNEICMAKAEDYPSWPAKICSAKDTDIASSLERLNRQLVALVGEMGGLRVVRDEDIHPFTGELDEDLSEAPKETRAQLEDCMAMTRRILRGSQATNRTNGKK